MNEVYNAVNAIIENELKTQGNTKENLAKILWNVRQVIEDWEENLINQ